ncbi:aromatic acid exporter family protein [Aeromicrobium sp. UC242_57]|uniref:aromatic acid exporter family protein n=1 Tax=Aeromicrobium sp. UC242_57 TaxID=3374624 RepID=UPI0037917165
MNGPRDIPLRRIRLNGSGDTWRDRLERVRKRWRLLLRLSVATGVSFFVATHMLGHSQAFFAPISAVIVIIAGAGLRGRTLFEPCWVWRSASSSASLLILTIGRGAWQMALVVVLTVVISTLIGIKGLALTQAANSSVLLAAVVPAANASNPAVTRFLDALIGGCAGLAMVLLVPRNPVRDIDVEVQSLLRKLSDVLAECAEAMRQEDSGAGREGARARPRLAAGSAGARGDGGERRRDRPDVADAVEATRSRRSLRGGRARSRQRDPRCPCAGPPYRSDAAPRRGRTSRHGPCGGLAGACRQDLRRRPVPAR